MRDRELQRDQHRRRQRGQPAGRSSSRGTNGDQRAQARSRPLWRRIAASRSAGVLAPDAERRVAAELEADRPVPDRRDVVVEQHRHEHENRDRREREREEGGVADPRRIVCRRTAAPGRAVRTSPRMRARASAPRPRGPASATKESTTSSATRESFAFEFGRTACTDSAPMHRRASLRASCRPRRAAAAGPARTARAIVARSKKTAAACAAGEVVPASRPREDQLEGHVRVVVDRARTCRPRGCPRETPVELVAVRDAGRRRSRPSSRRRSRSSWSCSARPGTRPGRSARARASVTGTSSCSGARRARGALRTASHSIRTSR